MIKEMRHPYEKELEMCDHLKNYLHSLKVKAGLVVEDEVAAQQMQQQMQKEAAQQRTTKKLEEGKIEISQSKKEREEAAMIQVGGGKKNKGKKKKEIVQYEDSFQLDLIIIKKFAHLGIVAPEKPEDLDDRIE